jgi:lipoprotein-anchoring transpeptidase ErfK/SrfK
MAVLAVEVQKKGALKFLSAALAVVTAFPGPIESQSQRVNGDWVQLSPSDPRAGIAEARASAASSGEVGETLVSYERRAKRAYRTRRDSIAAMNALEASKKDQSLRIVVSLDDRKLWVVAGVDTVMEAPVAIGSGDVLVFGEKIWQFDTPRGIRTVRGKDSDPHWTPPEWHYAETAREYGLKVATLSMNKPTRISGGRKILFKDGEAGVQHPDSGFAFLPLDEEIVFDNTIFIPPVGSKNRKVQGMLGKYKLDTGAGVLLHGTPEKNSIGKAATHGCLRLRDEDIEWLYDYVPVGTKVYIY